ncbi:MAG: hypothetical protein WCQ95_03395 [Bacteroidota bacterium]
MNKTITLDDLLLFVYDEFTDMSAKNAIKNAIKTENLLYKEFVRLNDAKHDLEKTMVNPPDQIVSNIISYSKALAVINVSEKDLDTLIKN